MRETFHREIQGKISKINIGNAVFNFIPSRDNYSVGSDPNYFYGFYINPDSIGALAAAHGNLKYEESAGKAVHKLNLGDNVNVYTDKGDILHYTTQATVILRPPTPTATVGDFSVEEVDYINNYTRSLLVRLLSLFPLSSTFIGELIKNITSTNGIIFQTCKAERGDPRALRSLKIATLDY